MKSPIEEAEVSFFYNNVEREIEEDGYVGRLTPAKAVIQVRIFPRPGRSIWGLNVNGKKKIDKKKDETVKMDPRPEYQLYQTGVQIKERNIETGEFHTQHPTNYFVLLVVNASGHSETYDVALVSQAGEFFITFQKVWEFQCYRDESGVLRCPRFELSQPRPEHESNWDELVEILKKIVQPDSFETADKYRPNPELPEIHEANVGLVTWWNQARGIGEVLTSKGRVKAHWQHSSVPKRPRLAFLNAGEKVRYEYLRDAVDTRLMHTSYVSQACHVSPIE